MCTQDMWEVERIGGKFTEWKISWRMKIDRPFGGKRDFSEK